MGCQDKSIDVEFRGAGSFASAWHSAVWVSRGSGPRPGHGASGSVGSAVVQLAVLRGARVIGTASPANHPYLRTLGAEPVAYGPGFTERLRSAAPAGVDRALDIAGSGVLRELTELAGSARHVVTVADFAGARQHGVRFSRGDDGRALHALAEVAALTAEGRFTAEVAATFPLGAIADAHRAGEQGTTGRGKLVLLVE